MTLSFLFWLLMLLWLLFSGWSGTRVAGDGRYGVWGSGLLLFFLFVILGLKMFGAPLKG